MHAQQLFVAVLMAAGAALTEARPAGDVAARDLGSLECNIARAKIVGALALTRGASNDIADAAVKNGTITGLETAGDGIKTIAQALITGGAPPAEARDVVKSGLEASAAALAGGDQYVVPPAPCASLTCFSRTDEAVTKATKTLQAAAAAGSDVVAKC